ncbi:MAG: tyrosine-type recombinase/integrase [Caldilineaceae bacterium]|nr:tyrosine-type recombinase/integrase [Caldilineaceae bacterium]
MNSIDSTPTSVSIGAPANSLLNTVERASTSYFRYLKVRKRSSSHLERIELSLSRFVIWICETNPDQVNADMFDEYALWLMEEYRPYPGTSQEGEPGTLSDASQRAYLTDLRGFVKWGGTRDFFDSRASTWVPVPPPSKGKPKRAHNVDIARIFEVAKHDLRDFTICCLLIDFGPRAGELATMRIENCDLDRRIVRVSGKTGDRHVMLSTLAANGLREWLTVRNTSVGYIFPGKKHGHLTGMGIHSVLRRLKKKAGVSGRVNPHAWRHAYITNSLVKGGNLGMTRVQAGHSNITTTQMYMEDFMSDELRDYQDRVTSLPDLIPVGAPSAEGTVIVLPRPTREDFQKAIWDRPNWEALGRSYGVSGVAVKKWAAKWGLIAEYDKAKAKSK